MTLVDLPRRNLASTFATACHHRFAMKYWRVELPPQSKRPFTVYINGVEQTEGRDFHVQDRQLLFSRPLKKAGPLSAWNWFLGAWGIGTYKANDEVDVLWDEGGVPRVAHALEIKAPVNP
jgi:hypothetical protein